MPVSMRQLLEEMVQRNSTDLHLTTGAPPMFRIDGELVPTNYEIMTPESIGTLCPILARRAKQAVEAA